MTRKPLDPRTLRALGTKFRKRANRLRKGHQWRDVTWGRAAELDLQADHALELAGTIERQQKQRRSK